MNRVRRGAARLGSLQGAPRVALIGGVALAARLLYLWSTASKPLDSDAAQYNELAVNLARGRGFAMEFPQLSLHPTAFRPPIYPWVLSLAYRIFWPSPGVGRLLAVIIGVATVILVDVLVRRHGSPLVADASAAGIVAALLAAVYPPLVANDTTTLSDGLSVLFLVGALVLLLDRRWLPGAVLIGLLVLTRASAQGLPVVIGLWAWWRLGWRRAVGVALVSIAVVVPWVVRNNDRLGSPVFVTSNGFNLASMYSPEARNDGHFVDPVFDPRFSAFRLDQFDEVVWDRALRHLATTSIRQHPDQVALVVARNTLAWFEWWPPLNTNAERLDGRNAAIRAWSIPLVWAVTLVGLYGLWGARRRGAMVGLLALVGAYLMATSLLLISVPRLRAPFDLFCCIGVALFVVARPAVTPSGTSSPPVGATRSPTP